MPLTEKTIHVTQTLKLVLRGVENILGKVKNADVTVQLYIFNVSKCGIVW